MNSDEHRVSEQIRETGTMSATEVSATEGAVTEGAATEGAAAKRPKLQRSVVIALIVTVAVILAACAVALNPNGEMDDEAVPAAETAVAEEEASDADASEAASWLLVGEEELYNGIPVGFTPDGYPYRGSVDAPVTMYEYSDYQCPFCSRYFVQTEPAINEQYVRDGTLRVIFRDLPLEQLHPNAPAAHAASLCVAEQGAALYWDMHGKIFRTQDEWANSPDPLAFFAQLAEEAGADLDQYNACMDAGSPAAMIAASIEEARSIGFGGTPSFRMVFEETGEAYDLVGAQPYERFAGYIDAIAAGQAPVDPEAEQQTDNEIPFWATMEGLAPDPDNPGQTMAGDQFRGNPEAEIVVIEFSDFQCPFCRRHTEETQPVLDERFVDTDQVRWVYKHFPLQIHPQAPMAGVAAECAGEQGQFWEMHELLFAETDAWSVNDPTDALIGLGEQLELDVEAFAACLSDEEMMARVDSDIADGAPYVQGTPTFVVLYNDQGTLIPGALPADQFTAQLDQFIELAGSNQE